jgi:hypothetical protein
MDSAMDEPFDPGQFLIRLPLWLVITREGPPPQHPANEHAGVVRVRGYVCLVNRGVRHVAVFTDRDLANRWVQHDDRLQTLVPAIIETPKQWIALLRGWELNGETRIGFDPGPDSGPAHIFSLRAILDGVLAAFGEDEGEA